MINRVTTRTLNAAAAGLLLMFCQTAMAASIQVMPPEDNQLVNQGDQFQITVEGLGFVDGSNGGGVDVTWDPNIMTLDTVDRSVFPGDGILGNDGTLSAPGFLQDLSVSSFGDGIGTSAPGPSFPIAILTFTLDVGNVPTNINLALGSFTSGAGDDVWTDGGSQLVDLQPGDFSGAQINSAVIPVPAAVWLFGSALGLLGWVRRRAA